MNNPTTWLAQFADWAVARVLKTQQEPAHTIDRYGQRLIVWGPERCETFPLDAPARRLVFSELASFIEYVRAQIPNTEKFKPAGASGSPLPWSPCVTVGPRFAQFTVDPYRHQQGALELTLDPAFELLERLEKAQQWLDQKAAHDLARLDLARLLPKAAADTLAAVAFRVTQETSRQVGPMTDRGVRQFAQEQPDQAGRIVGPFEIQAPVYTLACMDAEPLSYLARLTLDLSSRLDEDGTPRFRLAPIAGQCRLARLAAAGNLAGAIAAKLGDQIPVYLAAPAGSDAAGFQF